jgi:hypothetical protein
MNAVQKSLHDYVNMHIEMMHTMSVLAQMHQENNMYLRLKKEGHFFPVHKHRPSNYPLQQLGNCFQNAYRMLAHNELDYAEGIAYSGVIPVHHAWNVDKNGKVVDTTWRTRGKFAKYSTGREYFGIIIPRHELDKVLVKTQTYGYWKYA